MFERAHARKLSSETAYLKRTNVNCGVLQYSIESINQQLGSEETLNLEGLSEVLGKIFKRTEESHVNVQLDALKKANEYFKNEKLSNGDYSLKVNENFLLVGGKETKSLLDDLRYSVSELKSLIDKYSKYIGPYKKEIDSAVKFFSVDRSEEETEAYLKKHYNKAILSSPAKKMAKESIGILGVPVKNKPLVVDSKNSVAVFVEAMPKEGKEKSIDFSWYGDSEDFSNIVEDFISFYDSILQISIDQKIGMEIDTESPLNLNAQALNIVQLDIVWNQSLDLIYFIVEPLLEVYSSILTDMYYKVAGQ